MERLLSSERTAGDDDGSPHSTLQRNATGHAGVFDAGQRAQTRTPSRMIFASIAEAFSKRGPVSDMLIVTHVVRIEAGDRRRRARPSCGSAAPIRSGSTSARATSTTTRTERAFALLEAAAGRSAALFQGTGQVGARTLERGNQN